MQLQNPRILTPIKVANTKLMEHYGKIFNEKDSLEEEDGINIKMDFSETGYECIHRPI
jgi:hypothetical protein